MPVDFTLVAADGTRLAATLFAPPAGVAPRGVVVVNGATGVRRGYYAAFAEWVAAHGLVALTFDYRGIGGSRPTTLHAFTARMRDWGEQDIAAAIRWARSAHVDLPLHVIGHSGGGWLVPFAPNALDVATLTTIGTQSGHPRFWTGWRRAQLWATWNVTIPLAAHAFGKLPGVFGIGQDLPKGVALEWARWGRAREFTRADPGVREKYAAFAAPIRAFSFEDDSYAPRAAVEEMLSFFERAPKTHRHVRVAEFGPVGHFGVFRERFRETLWPEIAASAIG